MTDEQSRDWADYIESLWTTLMQRAASAAGGMVDPTTNVWGGNGPLQHVELETSVRRSLRDNPLTLVQHMEAFALELRREVTAAMAAGKFDYRPISTRESIQQMQEARAAQ